MRTRVVLYSAIVLVVATTMEAQQRVVAVTSAVLDPHGFGAQVGRDLLAPKQRFGLRLFAEYTRAQQLGPHRRLVVSDSGVFSEPGFVATQSRTAGVWLTGSYRPFRWFIEPHVIGGLGLQDSYQHYEASDPDSVSMLSDGLDQVSHQALTVTRTWLGPALVAGYGFSARIRRVSLFTEFSRRYELRRHPEGVNLGVSYPTIGIRF